MKITLSKGNVKIGNIVSFSIPSITTCPGRSEWCAKKCYAARLERIYPNVKKSYAGNLEAAESSDFVHEMTKSLQKVAKKTKLVRLHVSGDFYSLDYIAKWLEIMTINPDVTFYGYTKSWRVPELRNAVLMLAQLPNLTLFASLDDSVTEAPPVGMRTAYAGDTKPDKFLYCLEQNGKVETCEKCGICFKPNLKSNIYFHTH